MEAFVLTELPDAARRRARLLLRLEHPWTYALAQAAYWGGIGAIHVSLLLWFDRFTWQMASGYWTASLLGAAWTHVQRSPIARLGWLDLSPWQLAPRLIAPCLAGGAVVAMLAVALERVIFGPPWTIAWRISTVAAIASYWAALIAVWTVGWYVLHLFRESRRRDIAEWKMQAAVREAELGQLRSQLDPHFIFNSLNGIRGLIVEDPERAREMVTRLAGTLRYALQTHREPTVSLGDEMQTVRAYLDLESIRFEERLQTSYQLDPDSLEATVPPLIVQTLVENAIKHGIACQVDGGNLLVRSSCRDGGLVVEVRNTGKLGPEREGGVGLGNARERLQLLFGEAASLTLQQEGDEVVATLTIAGAVS